MGLNRRQAEQSRAIEITMIYSTQSSMILTVSNV